MHDVAKVTSSCTYKLVFTSTIDVYDFELQLLLLLVKVVYQEAGLELRIEVVEDLLGLAKFDPLLG